MGLAIRAYKQIKLVPNAVLDEDGEPVDYDNNIVLDTNNDYPDHANEIISGLVYTRGTDMLRFRAGSYGSYNRWRNQFAELAGYGSALAVWEGDLKGPFSELINFSDCEGVIGSTLSKKLYADFLEFDEDASKRDERFYELYREWTAAFEMAADDGVVEFC